MPHCIHTMTPQLASFTFFLPNEAIYALLHVSLKLDNKNMFKPNEAERLSPWSLQKYSNTVKVSKLLTRILFSLCNTSAL